MRMKARLIVAITAFLILTLLSASVFAIARHDCWWGLIEGGAVEQAIHDADDSDSCTNHNDSAGVGATEGYCRQEYGNISYQRFVETWCHAATEEGSAPGCDIEGVVECGSAAKGYDIHRINDKCATVNGKLPKVDANQQGYNCILGNGMHVSRTCDPTGGPEMVINSWWE
jgi:hypothetical protein